MQPGEIIHLVIYCLILAAGLGFFTRSIMARMKVLQLAESADMRGSVVRRLGDVIVHVFGQYRLLHGDFSAGFMHLLIFWGFVVLMLNTAHFLIAGFAPAADLHIPLLGREDFLGGPYLFLRDLFTVLVTLAVLYAIYRRTVIRPKRLTMSSEALLILSLIGTLMITEGLMNAAKVGAGVIGASPFSFIEGSLGSAMQSMPYNANMATFHVSWWLHLVSLLFFLNLLPLSKHFHVLTSVPKVYLRNLIPMGRLRKVEVEEEMEKDEPELGWRNLQQFSWSNWLDAYSCTECGRCDHFCPANRTGKVLSPQKIVTNSREVIYAHMPKMLVKIAEAQQRAKQLIAAGNGSQAASEGEGGVAVAVAEGPRPELRDIVLFEDWYEGPEFVGEVHLDEALWACTTCGACDTHCPLFIEHVQPIVEMRRHLVMEQDGRFPKELTGLFNGLERQGNPWGLPAHTRMDWAEGLNVPTLETNPEAEYLYYVGCFGSFDSRSKPTTRAMIELLNAAGVSYAVLGKNECCNGDPARRCGNEYLGQMMAMQLGEMFNEMHPKKVITTCPHCLNTFKNEYGDFGVEINEVIHHSDFLLKLVREGRLKAKGGGELGRIVFHDSCYLGRYNDIYDEPRELVKALPGAQIVEAGYNRDKGFCCGAGGGRMFMEETAGERVNQFRYKQLEETGAETIAVSCPFCMTMIDDAGNELSESARKVPVKDLAILLRDAVLGNG